MSTAAPGSALRATFDGTHVGRTLAVSETSAALDIVDSDQAKSKVVVNDAGRADRLRHRNADPIHHPHRRTP